MNIRQEARNICWKAWQELTKLTGRNRREQRYLNSIRHSIFSLPREVRDKEIEYYRNKKPEEKKEVEK